MTGRLIYSRSSKMITAAEELINTVNIAKGLYIIEIKGTSVNYKRKVILQVTPYLILSYLIKVIFPFLT